MLAFDKGQKTVSCKTTMIPLGSIVELKSGNKTMIIGYGLEDKESKKRFDYLGCDTAVGFMGGFKLFEFEDVKKVIFSGYSNEPLIDMYNKKVWEELQNE